MCFHIGALRNVNSRALAGIGTDCGYDTIGEMAIALPLARLLDALDRDDLLPKTMLFCMSPVMNPVLTAMTGCFQDGKIPGKLQFGPAWWFNDTKDGNLDQMRMLANHGVLGTFVGHAAYTQLLRELQPGARDLHRNALQVPRTGRRGGFALPFAARLDLGPHRRHPRGDRAQAARTRFRDRARGDPPPHERDGRVAAGPTVRARPASDQRRGDLYEACERAEP